MASTSGHLRARTLVPGPRSDGAPACFRTSRHLAPSKPGPRSPGRRTGRAGCLALLRRDLGRNRFHLRRHEHPRNAHRYTPWAPDALPWSWMCSPPTAWVLTPIASPRRARRSRCPPVLARCNAPSRFRRPMPSERRSSLDLICWCDRRQGCGRRRRRRPDRHYRDLAFLCSLVEDRCRLANECTPKDGSDSARAGPAQQPSRGMARA
jgi:hypothetical protein